MSIFVACNINSRTPQALGVMLLLTLGVGATNAAWAQTEQPVSQSPKQSVVAPGGQAPPRNATQTGSAPAPAGSMPAAGAAPGQTQAPGAMQQRRPRMPPISQTRMPRRTQLMPYARRPAAAMPRRSGYIPPSRVGSPLPLTAKQRRRIRQQRAQRRSQRRAWLRRRAYGRAMRTLMPLKPEQITRYRKEVQKRKKALREGIPKASSQTVRVTLEPGGAPSVVKLSPNYGGAITILDATGQPWPITSLTVGNGSAFQVTKPIDKGKGSSVLTVVPKLYYAHSNVILTLKGVATPIVLRLKTVPGIVDGRTDVIVAARGPNATSVVTARGAGSPDSLLMRNLLDGVPPQSATPINIKGGPARAWLINNKLFLRTTLDVLSPAWVASVSGASGLTVYEMPLTPTIIATDTDGVTVTLQLPSGTLVDGALARTSTTLGAIYGSHGSVGSTTAE